MPISAYDPYFITSNEVNIFHTFT